MQTRNILVAAASAAAMLGMATGALASGSVLATAPATVTVLSPTSLTKTQDMAFGSVVRPSNANTNTVTLDVNNTVTIAGSGNGAIVSSPATTAKFDFSAPAGTTYTTTQRLSFLQSGLTNVGASLPVATAGALGTVPAAGIQQLRYGGNFDMTSSSAAQTHTGTLSVTVNYN